VASYEDESEATRAHDRALFGGTPAERPTYYAERSPVTYADQVQAPVLIIAGSNDSHCPRRQIMNYVEQLRRHGKQFAYYEFDAGHGSLDVAEQVAQQELQISFARRFLPRAGRR
jgi:dipeptidyl aminopeptidase/acylaminoacyl peptidase